MKKLEPFKEEEEEEKEEAGPTPEGDGPGNLGKLNISSREIQIVSHLGTHGTANTYYYAMGINLNQVQTVVKPLNSLSC